MKKCIICKQIKPLTEFYFRTDQCKHRNECKDCFKAKKTLRESNIEVKKLRAGKEKQRRLIFKDTINKVLRKQRSTIEGKARLKENNRRMYLINPEKVKAWKQASRRMRRAHIRLTNSATHAECTNWLLQQPKICSYCGINCVVNYQLDHIDALSRGGTHTIDNFTIACPTCNNSKHNHVLIVWLLKRTSRS